MKEYIKPEAEFVKFDSEDVTASTGLLEGEIGIVSADVPNPWGDG